jgi:CDP-diacylglycerol--glycerol-3-phosphate 3-phosphatidyltransferase
MRPGPTRYTDSKLTVPNVLTALRIVMAAAAAVCFATATAERFAVLLCVVATALDAFDGWYARTFSQCSSLGEHLDPLADKMLMAVVYGVLAIRVESALVWALLALVGLRELGMTVFRSYSLRRHRKFIPANWLGKAKMIVQSTAGLALVAYGYYYSFDIPVAVVAVALAVILLISYVSAAVYLRSWFSITRRRLSPMEMPARAARTSERMVVGK